MSLRDDLLPVVYEARAIMGELGFREHSVAIVRVHRQGTHTGDGSRAESVQSITEANGYSPKVRWLKDDEVALGQLPKGSVQVGPITPEFSGGGTDLSDLTGADLERGDVRLLRITGPQHPNGADYRIVSVSADRALRHVITAIPSGTQAL